MKLLLTAIYLVLFIASSTVVADETNGGDGHKLQQQPKKTSATVTVGAKEKGIDNVEDIPPENNDGTDDGTDNKDDNNGMSSKNNNDDDDDESDGETTTEEKDDIVKEGKSVDTTTLGALSSKPVGKFISIVEVSDTKKNEETSLVQPPDLLEGPNHDDSNNSNNENSLDFYEKSKNISAQVLHSISVVATTNITLDAWKNQTWANKTPREVVDLLESEMAIMFHDKYVHVVFIATSIASILFTLYVVQQMIENPKGLLPKFCRCTVACLRIVCCPIYTILCCPCCASKKNRPSSKEYSHLPTHEAQDSK